MPRPGSLATSAPPAEDRREPRRRMPRRSGRRRSRGRLDGRERLRRRPVVARAMLRAGRAQDGGSLAPGGRDGGAHAAAGLAGRPTVVVVAYVAFCVVRPDLT